MDQRNRGSSSFVIRPDWVLRVKRIAVAMKGSAPRPARARRVRRQRRRGHRPLLRCERPLQVCTSRAADDPFEDPEAMTPALGVLDLT